ncbi:MAG: MerR family transcriptional regulator [Clostridia bacterium]|nr:MerR family transcriptional regulator [Clostridia bacterium]
MEYGIGETAKMCGITVKTLRHYDRIGLLHPDRVSEAGYRFYGERGLARLQTILFYRELDFPLAEIKAMLCGDNFDDKLAMQRQLELLMMKRERLDNLCALLNRILKGEKIMNLSAFDNGKIERLKKEYAEEAKALYGNTGEWAQSEARAQKRDSEQTASANSEAEGIFSAFSALLPGSPSDEAAQELVKRWHDHINRHHYDCSLEVFQSLGQMYTADERFYNYLDSFGKGTAEFMSEAIEIYCRKNGNNIE